MGDEAAVDAVLATARERGLSHVHTALFDGYGHLISKRSHVDNLRKAMTDGTSMVAAIFSADPSGRAMITSSVLAQPESGYGDALMRLDASSCRDFPLDADGHGLLLIGEFLGAQGDLCPRAQLRRELQHWQTLGLQVRGAFELECVMLEENLASLAQTSVKALSIRQVYARPYQLVADPEERAFLDALNELCARMEVGIDAQHPEFMHLLESSLRPELGLRIADNAALYKNMTKHLARGRGRTASFMARWHPEQQGCGAHINLSLLNADDGEPAFYDKQAADRLSSTLRHFVAGLQAYLPELFLLLAPNLNSYKRFVPGLFTPLGNSWGIDNKTVAYRVINQSPAAARVEVRPAGADVSPYLGLLAVLLAGRQGVEQQLDPLDPVVGNGWDRTDTPGNAFPLRFDAAIDAFESSALARGALGSRFVDWYVADRRWQIDQFQNTVTDWELQMFADGG